ncbi:lysosomal acid glucosylceramidase-like [Sceloporus undulatus]|uniref:lysosomal acid glucosylceramidase-like n=1 Tax=Sceloporus undulatus TaxID=8520 RepID=UPI001C4D7CE4|nr:lysosomal acid glucosylceramidase-like [Sceloporus undulatus]
MIAEVTASRPCAPLVFGPNAIVCVCNATYCDTLNPLSLPPFGTFVKYVSSRAGERLERSEGEFRTTPSGSGLLYTYNPFVQYQHIKGFGGSHTDAAAINIMRLSPAAQDHLIRSYFSEEGIEYNLLRLPMACSDFSTHAYTYGDKCLDDYELKCFSLAQEDTELRIPLLHRFMAFSKRPLSLIASPWTAPAWLRTSNQVMGKGRLKGEPGNIYHKTWARYFVRFLDEYTRYNITFWAVTAQNEPSSSVYIPMKNFPTTEFTPEEQRDFIIKDLGPALASSSHKNVLLIIHDDQRINLPKWANVVIGNSSAAKYVSGIGIHWYLDSVTLPGLTLDATYLLYPDFFLLYTESCNGFRIWEPKVDLGSWDRGVRYSRSILTNLNSFVVGWIDWNLALDMEGGPNFVENHVDSPIIVNSLRDEFYKQPMFYHLAHFSKFIPEGSIRVALTCNCAVTSCQLHSAGFLRPDGIAVVVVLNDCFWDVEFSIADDKVGYIEDVARANSIQTYLWERCP